jgi:hypothetical protein
LKRSSRTTARAASDAGRNHHGAHRRHSTCRSAYIDLNRSVADVDPELLANAWPGPLAPSRKTAQGIGLVRRHGRPAVQRHSLQIEVNRRLYMDEETLAPNAGYAKLENDLERLLIAMAAFVRLRVSEIRDQGSGITDWTSGD